MEEKKEVLVSEKVITLKELLEAGVHFGHQAHRWNPKMKPYLYCKRDKIHIFDLAQTAQALTVASDFAKNLGQQGKILVFVGTKRQAQTAVKEEAKRCGAKYLTKRWIGGLITNWDEVQKNIKKLVLLEEEKTEEKLKDYTKKEKLKIDREIAKLEGLYGGLRGLEKVPDALFILDAHKQVGAVAEANKKGVSVIAICDSNADPGGVDYPIPGNDDAVKAIGLYCKLIADAYLEGRKIYEKETHSD
jgi:small subunit ribosomal protein S2